MAWRPGGTPSSACLFTGGFTASPATVGRPDWGRCTVKDRHPYLHVFDWPADGTVKVTGIADPVRQARLLASGEEFEFQQTGGHVTVTVPREAPDPIVTVIALEM